MRVELNKDGLNLHHRQGSSDIDIHDRVNQAYRGDLGASFQEKTRRRVDWVVSQVSGAKILDVGCSQGIVPILLGRKGITVTGVDIDQDAVTDANKDLSAESKKVRDKVNFVCDDFLKYKPSTKSFDGVIFSEFLEHLYEPEKFIEQAFQVTRVGGRIIITVPFGINDYPDHRQNFYLIEMYEMLSQYYEVISVEIMTKWIGFVGERRPKKTTPGQPDLQTLKEAESAFYEIERDLVDMTYRLKDRIHTLERNGRRHANVLEKTQNDYRNLKETNRLISESASYKIGRAITRPYRLIREIVSAGRKKL